MFGNFICHEGSRQKMEGNVRSQKGLGKMRKGEGEREKSLSERDWGGLKAPRRRLWKLLDIY